jgi:hypothetical protein
MCHARPVEGSRPRDCLLGAFGPYKRPEVLMRHKGLSASGLMAGGGVSLISPLSAINMAEGEPSEL